MKYSIERTAQFKRDFKLAEKQGLDMTELAKVIMILANGDRLPDKYRDHELQGNYIFNNTYKSIEEILRW